MTRSWSLSWRRIEKKIEPRINTDEHGCKAVQQLGSTVFHLDYPQKTVRTIGLKSFAVTLFWETVKNANYW